MARLFLGICGRAHAGKTTIAEHLAGVTEYLYEESDNPLNYIIGVLFGEDFAKGLLPYDDIWHLTYAQAEAKLLYLLRKYVDTNYTFPTRALVALNKPLPKQQEWKEFSLAEALKKIASVIFGINHWILLGNSEESRRIREEVHTPEYNIIGSLTGRQCLEYLGTEVFRNHFDQDIWLKILARGISSEKRNIIVSDVRFVNEAKLFIDSGAKLVIVYREPHDLILTEADKRTHPSKWKFLTFDNLWKEKIYKLHNNGSKEELYSSISEIIKKERQSAVL